MTSSQDFARQVLRLMKNSSARIRSVWAFAIVMTFCVTTSAQTVGTPLHSKSEAQREQPARMTLVLNGPFVLCDDGSSTLRVLVPDVLDNPPGHKPDDPDLSHYMPGFTATLSETPLAKAPDRPNPKDFTLNLGYSAAGTSIDEGNAILDKVKAGTDPTAICPAQSSELLVNLKIPRPDRIVTMLPVQVTVSRPGFTKSDMFATRLALIYNGVYLSKVAVSHGANLFWASDGRSVFRDQNDPGILVFDLLRKQDDPEVNDANGSHLHALYVNDVMNRVSGVTRSLVYPPTAMDTKETRGRLGEFNMHHGDCYSPALLVCLAGSSVCK